MARWIVVGLLGLVGGFMTLDGVRALTVGDYLTPSTGPHAGQLGPWARLVAVVGIGPRSTAMKAGFAMLGLLHLAAAVALSLSSAAPAGWLALIAGWSGLWYLPFGTVADLVVVMLVVTTELRPWD